MHCGVPVWFEKKKKSAAGSLQAEQAPDAMEQHRGLKAVRPFSHPQRSVGLLDSTSIKFPEMWLPVWPYIGRRSDSFRLRGRTPER